MIIGITGGVGSGKSTALSIISSVYKTRELQTDGIAKELMQETELLDRLSEAFGLDVRGADGLLDKELYTRLIFESRENAAISDSIVHPEVWKRSEELAKRAEEKGELVLLETALPGPDFRRICDYIVLLKSPEKNRAERLKEERGYTREHFQDMLDTQPDEASYESYADFVIANNGSMEEFKQRILKCIDDICKLGQREQR